MTQAISSQTLRRLALAGSGLTFGAIGLIGIAAPHGYGLSLPGVDGLNELRAVFTGFWLSLAVAMLTAARRPEETLLGDLCGLMILMQAAGRVTSIAIDGRPSWQIFGALAAELASAALILRPRLSASRSSRAARPA